MTNELAIIVPAYKPDYLKETIQSILDQTDQRFSLYIFDDASPHHIGKIVNRYQGDGNIHYQRFNENWGQDSLVLQWQRCIDHTNNEKWLWLFSDDDVMSKNCVESFYRTQKNNPGFAAYRFHTQKITADGEVIRENQFPGTFDATDFLQLKLSYTQESYIVEYIFPREVYKDIGGIPDLPLAWTADDLFCLKLADYSGICTINDGTVKWRYHDSNISGKRSRFNANLKLEAAHKFVKWIVNHKPIRERLDSNDLPITWYIRQIRSMNGQLTRLDELKAVYRISQLDKTAWGHYFRMKKEKSRFVEWLKEFSL